MKKMIALSALVLMLAAGTVTVMTVQPQAAVAGPCSQCVTESCPTAGGCVTESCPSANGCVAAEPATPARVACTSPNCVNEDCPNGNGGHFRFEAGEAGDISTRSGQAGNEVRTDRIGGERKYNRNGPGFALECSSLGS